MADPAALMEGIEAQLASDDPLRWADGLARLRTAAEAGNPAACFHLGLAHAQGRAGLARDDAEAARWCAIAAHAGLGVAQFNLALLHVAGRGVEQDTRAADRWLRLAAANGVEEAEGCLALVHPPAATRPTTWEEADTRASVALVRTDPQAAKTLRFAEYYVDPCIDLLIRRFDLPREQIEDIVQQFMLELEEPLSKGAHRGKMWKDVLRARYDATRQERSRSRFRAYLGRILENFARDWLRLRRNPGAGGETPPTASLDEVVDLHAPQWRAVLDGFLSAARTRPSAARAAEVLVGQLADRLDQEALAARFGVTDRTVRSCMRMGTELFIVWLEDALGRANGIDAITREGLVLLPDWLHYPSGDKRARALLFLALVGQRLQR